MFQIVQDDDNETKIPSRINTMMPRFKLVAAATKDKYKDAYNRTSLQYYSDYNKKPLGTPRMKYLTTSTARLYSHIYFRDLTT